MVEPVSDYPTPALAEQMHNWQHYNWKMEKVDNTFDFDKPDYMASILRLFLPMTITALIFCIWFAISFWKHPKTTNYPKFWCVQFPWGIAPSTVKSGRYILAGFVLVIWVLIGLLFANNALCTKGFTFFTDGTSKISEEIGKAQVFLGNVSDGAQTGADVSIQFFNTTLGRSYSTDMATIATSTLEWRRQAELFDPASENDNLQKIDLIRSVSMYVGLSIMALCVTVVVASLIARSANCLLKFATSMTLLALFISWMMCSANVAVSQAVADYCDAPFMASYRKNTNEISKYYLFCQTESPFQLYYQQSIGLALRANATMTVIGQTEDPLGLAPLFIEQTEFAAAVIQGVYEGQKCISPHAGDEAAIGGICHDALTTSVTMMYAFGVCGLFILFLAYGMKWLEVASLENGYRLVEEQSMLMSSDDSKKQFDSYGSTGPGSSEV